MRVSDRRGMRPRHSGSDDLTKGGTGLAKTAVRSHGLLAAQQQILAAELQTSPSTWFWRSSHLVLSNLGSGSASLIPECDLSIPVTWSGAITERVRQLESRGIQGLTGRSWRKWRSLQSPRHKALRHPPDLHREEAPVFRAC